MNLTDFTNALNSCGASVDHTWKEEDKNGVNSLNSMVAKPLFIGEEIKKNIPAASRSSVITCMRPKVSYRSYGKISSFKSNGFVLPSPKPVSNKPFTPDIVVNTSGKISFIEIKKITNQTWIRNRNAPVPTCPTIFASSKTTLSLTSNIYGDSAIFSSPSNGNIMTSFHEGQIFNDVARLLNFRKSNEKLFFVAFIFSPASLKITQTDIENRLAAILKAFNQNFTEIFSEGYGYLNSWSLLSLTSSSQFIKASSNGFNNGVKSYGVKNNFDVYAMAFEIN